MPETIDNRKVFSLLEVTQSIERTLAARYSSSFWVKAELLRLNHYPRSGHCYPDLVEKSEGKIVAQIRANLWSKIYRKVNGNFLEITGEPLKDGINILFNARVNYHPVHGLALHILDIDPAFTLGDMIREKQETIRRLQAEQIFDRNKQLPFPLLPQRIAVISVETSKGFSDFRAKIDQNPFGYRFFYMLFPSLLQGDHAVRELLEQFRRIRKIKEHFDVVAVIRGGGGDVGLSCYDDYNLAKEIALFPLPVLTGIGHSTNETVSQMVAFYNNITPTDLANFLIQQFHNFLVPLEERERRIIESGRQLIRDEKNSMAEVVKYFRSVTRNLINEKDSDLNQIKKDIRNYSRSFIQKIRNQLVQQHALFGIHLKNLVGQRKNNLTDLENQIRLLHPENVLKRGFSITRAEGKAILNCAEIKEGDIIETELKEGKIRSIVGLSNKRK